jgi:hypothetical protein
MALRLAEDLGIIIAGRARRSLSLSSGIRHCENLSCDDENYEEDDGSRILSREISLSP